MHHKKMSPNVHNSKEFKEARKTFQGINSTPAKAKDKSVARHKKHEMAKKMKRQHQIADMHRRDGVVDKTPLDFSGASEDDYR